MDIYTIIFAALAVVVCLRLYSVLGQHTGSGYVTGILLAVTAAALGVVVFDVGGAKWFPAQATVGLDRFRKGRREAGPAADR